MSNHDIDLNVIKYRQARGYNKCEVSRDGDIDSLILKVDELTEANKDLKEEVEDLKEEVENLEDALEDIK